MTFFTILRELQNADVIQGVMTLVLEDIYMSHLLFIPLLGLQKAFDTVDHSVLLYEASYGW